MAQSRNLFTIHGNMYNESEKPLRSEPTSNYTISQDNEPPESRCRCCGNSGGGREYFSEYCNNTSLHGLKYVGGENRSAIEKIVWIILFCASVTGCTYMITATYIKWQNSPVIVSFAQNPTSISSIPFPAITICPQNKVKQTLFNYTQLYRKFRDNSLTASENKTFERLSLVCDYMRKYDIETPDDDYEYDEDDEDVSDYDDEYQYIDEDEDEDDDGDEEDYDGGDGEEEKKLEYFTAKEDESLIKFLMKAAPKNKDIFDHCIWKSRPVSCRKFFKPTLNEDGICFTFNMLSDEDLFTKNVFQYEDFGIHRNHTQATWTAEDGYERKKESYPKRVIGPGIKNGLELQLKSIDDDFDYLCKNTIQGFKVILHEPGDIARGNTHYIRAPLDQEINISIEPKFMKTSDNLKNYSPHKRHCFFQHERKLRFFKRYTQKNCELECLAVHAARACGCAAYYMPRNKTTPICGAGNSTCIERVESNIMEMSLRDTSDNFNYVEPCNCMPSCFALSYSAETSQAPYDWYLFQQTLDEVRAGEPDEEEDDEDYDYDYLETENEVGSGDGAEEDGGEEEEEEDEEGEGEQEQKADPYSAQHYSAVKIFFKDIQFIATERSELYGYTDFLANCGGLFGLFTGFSILSLMEIIYYCSLRSWINKNLFGRFCMQTPDDPEEFIRNRKNYR